MRAAWAAWRAGDTYSIAISTRPRDVVTLLQLAEGHDDVTEIGTATAWTTVAFALADDARRVRSYDPEVHPERERYLKLAQPVRDRIELHRHRAEEAQPKATSTGLVFVDGAHDRESTINAYRTFVPAVQPGGAIAFHDYGHPRYPGVSEAVQELGLRGEVKGGIFVWRKDA